MGLFKKILLVFFILVLLSMGFFVWVYFFDKNKGIPSEKLPENSLIKELNKPFNGSGTPPTTKEVYKALNKPLLGAKNVKAKNSNIINELNQPFK